MENIKYPYKNVSEVSVVQMTIKLVILALFLISSTICFIITLKGIFDLLKT